MDELLHQKPLRNKIIHGNDASIFSSDYELTEHALGPDGYNVKKSKFGSTEVLNQGSSFRVRDAQYQLGNESVGMHFIPVSDSNSVLKPSGINQSGHQQIDQFLRRTMGLKDSEQIYALLNYFHPELNKGTLKSLLTDDEGDKLTLGFTHLAAYLGRGYTSNAPMLYHHHHFGVDGFYDRPPGKTCYGYPANIQIISLDGEDQATLNKNFMYVDTCLNSGVMFPNRSSTEYKNTKFRTIDINTSLMYYRDWINFKSYLRTDPSWFNYCAAHKTIVANIAVNLPHNCNAFQEVYGKIDGKDLFDKFKLFYMSIIGPDPEFSSSDETHFEPLWKKENLTCDQIKPFTLQEYENYEKAFLGNDLAKFKGMKPLPAHKATCWAPHQTADIIYDFVRVYADFMDVGAVDSSAVIIGFMPLIEERMGISAQNYLCHAMPIISKLMIADAKIKMEKNSAVYLKKAFEQLTLAYGGKLADSLSFDKARERLERIGLENTSQVIESVIQNRWSPAIMAAWSLYGVFSKSQEILQNGPISKVKAYEELVKDIENDLSYADSDHIGDSSKVQYNATPCLTHTIAVGLNRHNKFVKIREVATIIDVTELKVKLK